MLTVVVVVVLILGGACSADDDGAASSADSRDDTVPDRLPIEPILFPGLDALNQLADAYDAVVSKCMAAEGFTLEIDRVDAPEELANPFDPERRYGDISRETAQKFGYRSPYAEYQAAVARQMKKDAESPPSRAESEALTGSGVQQTDNGEFTPEHEGCVGQAARAVFGAPQGMEGMPGYQQLLDMSIEASNRTSAHPSVKAAESRWSDCMLAQGFRFTTSTGPRDMYSASADDTTPPTEAERQTALADATCRSETELTETYLRIESAFQTKELEGMQQQVHDFESALDAAIRRAADAR